MVVDEAPAFASIARNPAKAPAPLVNLDRVLSAVKGNPGQRDPSLDINPTA